MLNRNEFCEAMREAIENRIRDKGRVVKAELKEITKDNGATRTGLVFTGESSVRPIIYIDSLFKQFQVGRAFNEIADAMADFYMESETQDFDMKLVTDWKLARNHIQVCVRNAEMNKDLLREIPHKIVEDLAVMYRVQLGNCPGGTIGSVLVNNKLMNNYGIDLESLHVQAWRNTKEQNACSFKSMFEVLTDAMPGIDKDMHFDKRLPLYVLTSKNKTDGAAYLCDNNTMSKIAAILGEKLIILPTSIHECVILPGSGNYDADKLKDMVRETNDMRNLRNEVLSYNVYCYDAQTQEISIYDGQNSGISMMNQM